MLVLKRIRAGDQDLIAKGYTQVGVVDVLIRDGLLVENRFFGIFEPFNVLEIDLRQQGNITVPNDIFEVRRLSYLASDFSRFLWMSWVCGFVLKYVKYYDERLFNLFVSYLTLKPSGTKEVYRIKLLSEFLELSGLKPKFLEEKLPKGEVKVNLSDGSISESGELKVPAGTLRLIKRIHSSKELNRISANSKNLTLAEDLLRKYLEYHTK